MDAEPCGGPLPFPELAAYLAIRQASTRLRRDPTGELSFFDVDPFLAKLRDAIDEHEGLSAELAASR